MAHIADPHAQIYAADTHEPLRVPSGRRFVLVAIGVGALMSSLDSSIVNAVLPVITRALGSDVAATQWIVTIYLLVLSGLMLTFGRLGDCSATSACTCGASGCSSSAPRPVGWLPHCRCSSPPARSRASAQRC